MEHEEQKPSTNPSVMLSGLLCKRAKLHEELRVIEKQLTSKFVGRSLKRSRKFGPEDRLFSLSSITSPAAEEHAAARDAGGLLANGQGKPKRGRGPRDGRRSKQSSEPDYDYDDDPDVIM
ncbi:hypothetical protein AgCh_035038 [Apium graveolens]